jgi:hypothetical protein
MDPQETGKAIHSDNYNSMDDGRLLVAALPGRKSGIKALRADLVETALEAMYIKEADQFVVSSMNRG